MSCHRRPTHFRKFVGDLPAGRLCEGNCVIEKALNLSRLVRLKNISLKPPLKDGEAD